MVQPQIKISPEEYLALERVAEISHEYHNGEIIERPGASFAHVQITGNLIGLLSSWFLGKLGHVLGSGMQVAVPLKNYYVYPDVTVITDAPQLINTSGMQTLTNPAAVIEVLSDSTEKNDREVKSLAYRTLPSLQAYLLVSQKQYSVELYERVGGHDWKLTHLQGGNQSFNLLGCDLKLADIYDKVQFLNY